jgi:hypothetical protein
MITPKNSDENFKTLENFFKTSNGKKNSVGRNFYCAQRNFRREHAMLHRLAFTAKIVHHAMKEKCFIPWIICTKDGYKKQETASSKNCCDY